MATRKPLVNAGGFPEELPVGDILEADVELENSIQDLYNKIDTTNNGKKSLLIYYGFPIAYNGIWTTEGVIGEISKFNYFVCGDTYQQPTHGEFASTTAIVNGVRALGTKVYGYVPIGVNTENRSMATLKTAVDQWIALGVDGIFLDEFGFDYAVTRERQIEITDYVKSKGVPFCANAWTFEDVACASVTELPWVSTDWRYVNFVTYNPNNLPLNYDSNDSYLIENFCFDNTAALGKFDAQERYDLIRQRNIALAKPLKIWAEAVFKENPAGSGNINTSAIGGLKVTDLGSYLVANAYIFDIDVLGAGGFSFGANGTPVVIDIPRLPDYVRFTYPLQTAPAVNMTTGECSRVINQNYSLAIKNQSGITVTVSDTVGKPVATVPETISSIVSTAITNIDPYTQDTVEVNYVCSAIISLPAAGTTVATMTGSKVVAVGDTAIIIDTKVANFAKTVSLTAGGWVLQSGTVPARRTFMATTPIKFEATQTTSYQYAGYPVVCDTINKRIIAKTASLVNASNVGVTDGTTNNSLDQYLGAKSTLSTTDKTSLIAAINELNAGKTPRAVSGGTTDNTLLMANAPIGSCQAYVSLTTPGADWPQIIPNAPQWWNVYTYGQATRVTQVAMQAFSALPYMMIRSLHDTTWSAWTRCNVGSPTVGMLAYDGLLGYVANKGLGGTVTQATSKTTGVTLNKLSGTITMNAAALAANKSVVFGLTNTYGLITNAVIARTGKFGSNYRVEVYNESGGVIYFRVTNISAASRSEALEINFTIIQGTTT